MERIKGTRVTEWILQAHLSINPARPEWSDVAFHGVQNWQLHHDGSRHCPVHDERLKDGRAEWSFVSREAAEAVLKELVAVPQKYQLRVIERTTYVDEWVLDGGDHG